MLIDVLTQNFIHGGPFGSSLRRIFDFFETLIFARDRARFRAIALQKAKNVVIFIAKTKSRPTFKI